MSVQMSSSATYSTTTISSLPTSDEVVLGYDVAGLQKVTKVYQTFLDTTTTPVLGFQFKSTYLAQHFVSLLNSNKNASKAGLFSFDGTEGYIQFSAVATNKNPSHDELISTVQKALEEINTRVSLGYQIPDLLIVTTTYRTFFDSSKIPVLAFQFQNTSQAYRFADSLKFKESGRKEGLFSTDGTEGYLEFSANATNEKPSHNELISIMQKALEEEGYSKK